MPDSMNDAKPLILSPYARFGIVGDKLRLGVGSKTSLIEDPLLQRAIVESAEYWRRPATIDEAEAALGDKLGVDQLSRAVAHLREQRLLVDAEGLEFEEQFSRNQLYYLLEGASPKRVQERLARAHVTIIGCGGVGSNIGVALAASGVGRFLIIDGDTVELSNLTRQFFFTQNDIGDYKVNAIAREMTARNQHVAVDARTQFAEGPELKDLVPADSFIIAAADGGSSIMAEINRLAIVREQAFISGGYSYDTAVVGPLLHPPETACYYCPDLYLEAPALGTGIVQSVRRLNRIHVAPAIGALTMLATNLATFDILRYLGGFGEVISLGARIGVVPATLAIEKVPWRRHPECPVCGRVSERALSNG